MKQKEMRLSIASLLLVLSGMLLTACQTNGQSGSNESDTAERDKQSVRNNDITDMNEANYEHHDKDERDAMPLKEVTPDEWQVEVLAENLNIPWALNVHEDVIFMTDREGHIIEIENGETTQSELQTSTPVAHIGEGGLLGFVLAEDFFDTGEAYAYYTYQTDEGHFENRIVRVEQQHNNGWSETEILLDNIPGAEIHNGGRLAVGPDGMLYAAIGDADIPDAAQDESNLAGTILRMTPEGDIPEDNPIEGSYVYSYGHRNPQGLAWRNNGEMYSSEHGAVGHDEINIIESGHNYGWPVIEGDETEEGMEEPLIHSGEDTWAPSGVTFWEEQLLVTGLRGEALYLFDEEGEEMIDIFSGEGRLRDVTYDGDALYVITNNRDGRGQPKENDDRLLKLTLNQ
ncbi:PQQ-dependent sugar dehydrogenase [Salipaludibacillus agaradhaerens]|nr:PQQ-dependent sugar dehydrogenase [Salipaludibacillus agaradhaerens]